MKENDLEIDLMKGLESKEEAKKAVKKVQAVVDELTLASLEYKKVAEAAVELADGYETHVQTMAGSIKDMSDTLKNIFTVLGTKKDLFGDDAEMKVLMDGLAVFTIGASSVFGNKTSEVTG